MYVCIIPLTHDIIPSNVYPQIPDIPPSLDTRYHHHGEICYTVELTIRIYSYHTHPRGHYPYVYSIVCVSCTPLHSTWDLVWIPERSGDPRYHDPNPDLSLLTTPQTQLYV